MLGSRRRRLLAGLELRIAGSRNRSEHLLLELVELRACRAMLALQLEMLADRVVEDSHEPEGLQMPAYGGGVPNVALLRRLLRFPCALATPPGAKYPPACGATPHLGL